MVGWYHQFNGHGFEQTLGDGEGRETWHAAVGGQKELGVTERLNNNSKLRSETY